MKNKIYKIRKKDTGEFIGLGYNNKHTWLAFPYTAIRYSRDIIDFEDYEVVVYEYKEIDTLPLKINKK